MGLSVISEVKNRGSRRASRGSLRSHDLPFTLGDFHVGAASPAFLTVVCPLLFLTPWIKQWNFEWLEVLSITGYDG